VSARSKARKQALDLLFEADIRGTNSLEILNARDVVMPDLSANTLAHLLSV